MKRYYYEWGNEPSGYVSTYTVENGLSIDGPQMERSAAIANGYTFDCPYS